MKTVVFTEDFATKLKGDTLECDGQLASHLVHIDKVAKYPDDETEITKAKTTKKTKP